MNLTRVFLGGAIACCAGLAMAADGFRLPQQPSEDRTLEERFVEPPPSSRILRIIHGQQGEVAAQDAELGQLARRGFGGFAGNVTFSGYVDDPKAWPPYLRGVALAKESGMRLWLYDECGYPSGSARDLVLAGRPEWAARGLLVAVTNVPGGAEVSMDCPPGLLRSAVAWPASPGATNIIAINTAVTDNHLLWKAPNGGEWKVLLATEDFMYKSTHAAVSLAFKKPYVNLLMSEPTRRFLEVTHGAYAAHLGKDLGKTYVATFTDEPSLMSLWMMPMPYYVLPWSPELPMLFKERTGRELLPLLPLLTDGGVCGAEAGAVRFAFWNLVGDLVSRNYFGQIRDWCRDHGFESGGHLLCEENTASHPAFYGDFFECIRQLDAPSCDCLTSIPPSVPWKTARLLASAAELNERRYVMCEVSDHSQRYRPAGDKRPPVIVTEEQVLGTCYKLICGGINTFTSYYGWNQFGDEQVKEINMRVGRCITMMAGGHSAADIALLYPSDALKAAFTPSYFWSNGRGVRRVADAFDSAGTSLYGDGREYTVIDAAAVSEASVRGGQLRHGKLRWDALVLPCAEALPLKALRRAYAFWKSGGVVIAMGKIPTNSGDAFPCKETAELSAEMFGNGKEFSAKSSSSGGSAVFLPPSLYTLLPRVLDKTLRKDVEVIAGDAAPIHSAHRVVDGREVYLVTNESEQPWKGAIAFNGAIVDAVWNPEDGTHGNVSAELSLPVYGAKLFTGREGRSLRVKGAAENRTSFSLGHRELAKPSAVDAGGNPTVKSVFDGNAAEGWTSRAELTQGGIDTHHFVNFHYAEPQDFSDAAGLEIETSVPVGADTSAMLLVFIITPEGRYLASTGRCFGEAGTERVCVGLSQFNAFGETKGPLNPSKVTCIEIGWGGYFGRAGEKIVFTAKAPELFTIQ